MAALPSWPESIFNANAAFARETNRVADLPGNIFRLFVFVRDLFIAKEQALCASADVEATEQSEEGRSRGRSRGEVLDSFLAREDQALARGAIDELGLVREDLLNIVDLICERRFDRLRRALLQTEPATVAKGGARAPATRSAK